MLKPLRKFRRANRQAWSIHRLAVDSIRVVHISWRVYVMWNFLRILNLNRVIWLPAGYIKNDRSHSTLGSDLNWFSALADGYDLAFFDRHSHPAIDFLSELFFLWCVADRCDAWDHWSLSLRSR